VGSGQWAGSKKQAGRGLDESERDFLAVGFDVCSDPRLSAKISGLFLSAARSATELVVINGLNYIFHTLPVMMFSVPMNRYLSIFRSRLTKFLLVALILSSSAAIHARSAAGKRTSEPGPNSVHTTATLSRNYALTVVPSQRIASDVSKQNSIKRSVIHGGLARRESGLPANLPRPLLVVNERSLSYLSFRLIRTGGRAPPSLA
jgi:hypothetical protein